MQRTLGRVARGRAGPDEMRTQQPEHAVRIPALHRRKQRASMDGPLTAVERALNTCSQPAPEGKDHKRQNPQRPKVGTGRAKGSLGCMKSKTHTKELNPVTNTESSSPERDGASPTFPGSCKAVAYSVQNPRSLKADYVW